MSSRNTDPSEFRDASDHARFLTYFARDHQRIFAYIYSQLHNRADTEDVFQQTSLVLWQKFSAFDQERDFFPWACGVAFFSVKNFLRVSGRSRLHFSDELLKTIAEERVVIDPKLQLYNDNLTACINKLSEKDQSLVREVYAEDKTIIEIAESLGRAVQTLYNRLNLIRSQLAKCVDRRMDASKITEGESS